MPTIDVPPFLQLGGTGWTPSSGTVVSCLQAIGSGKFVSYTSIGGAVAQLQFFQNPPGFLGTVTALDFLVNASGAAGSISQRVALDFHASSGWTNQFTGPIIVTTTPTLYVVPYTGSFGSLFDLWNSFLELEAPASGTYTAIVDYVAFRVTYDPPPDPRVLVWCCGDHPPGCVQPPPRAFRPLGLFDPGVTLPSDVTAAYLYKYGKPRPGFSLWSYCRTFSTGLYPDPDSPASFFEVLPW